MYEVRILAGWNKIRLTTKRGQEVTEEVNNSVKVTLQKQLEQIVGKIILADAKGQELPLIETLTQQRAILNTLLLSQSIVSCPLVPIKIPGIAPADAFDAGDCFGTIARVAVPKRGIILGGTFWDYDDEGSQVDLELFQESIVQIASDAAWAPTDESLQHFLTELAFYAFDDHINNQTSELVNVNKAYTSPLGSFWIQAVNRGTPTIAAGSEPEFQLQILSLDPEFVEG